MKRAVLILLTIALLTTAGAVLAGEASGKAAAPGEALATPATPATPAEVPSETADEPLFLDDGPMNECPSLDPYVNCTATYRCATNVTCTFPGMGVEYRTCTCCRPCPTPPCDCETNTVAVGCC